MDLNVTPWKITDDAKMVCRHCGRLYTYQPRYLDAHEPTCPWRQAAEASGQVVPESNWRARGKHLLQE